MKRTRKSVIVGFVMVAACAAASAETGMKTVVNLLEARYPVHHHGIPGLWVAKPFLAISGMGSLKIAAFGKFRPPAADAYVLGHAVERALGPEWSPFVETWSKSDGEWASIFGKAAGDGMKFLIVSSDGDDGLTLLQVNVSGRAARFWLEEPAECAKRVSGRRTKDQDTRTAEIASGGVDLARSGPIVSKPPEP